MAKPCGVVPRKKPVAMIDSLRPDISSDIRRLRRVERELKRDEDNVLEEETKLRILEGEKATLTRRLEGLARDLRLVSDDSRKLDRLITTQNESINNAKIGVQGKIGELKARKAAAAQKGAMIAEIETSLHAATRTEYLAWSEFEGSSDVEASSDFAETIIEDQNIPTSDADSHAKLRSILERGKDIHASLVDVLRHPATVENRRAAIFEELDELSRDLDEFVADEGSSARDEIRDRKEKERRHFRIIDEHVETWGGIEGARTWAEGLLQEGLV